MASSWFTLEIHYNGYFVDLPQKMYFGGEIHMEPSIDPDRMSYLEMQSILEDLRQPRVATIYHKMPDQDIDDGLRLVSTDQDVLDMFAIHTGRGNIQIYIVADMDEVLNEVPLAAMEMDGVQKPIEVEEVNLVDSSSDSHYSMIGEEDSCSDSDYDPHIYGGHVGGGVNEDDESMEDGNSHEGEGLKDGNSAKAEGRGDGNISEGDEVLSDYAPSDELCSLVDSDMEDEAPRYPEFHEDRDMENPQLCIGQLFSSAAVFRAALREHCIKEGRDFRFKKNESTRVTAVCKFECGWRIHAYKKGDTSFQITSYQPKHSCPRTYENRQANSAWLSRHYLEKLRDDPKWKTKAMQRTIRRELMIDVSPMQVYRAKRRAIEQIEGNAAKQYMKIRVYAMMILRHNPGSAAWVKVERPRLDVAATFQRLFVVFDAQRRGLLAGVRPFIGLDACHLKGHFGGQLLHAVARDGNDRMYPVAMAVVEAECKDSWSWFLENLVAVIGSFEEFGWTFISDRQKGLVPSFDAVLPRADHRFCIRHMYANFKAEFKGKALKDLMWQAASAYTVQEFTQAMEKIKKKSQAAYNWLAAVNPTQWARHAFTSRPKCDLLSNNLSESFNSMIMEARDKPIITCIETIRRIIMKRYQVNKAKMSHHQWLLCPRIQQKLEDRKEDAKFCEATYAGGRLFEVTCKSQTLVVDLERRTCICRQWDLTGVPCCHAITAIYVDGAQPEEYVDPYFHVQTYLRSYEPHIVPIPDEQHWIGVDLGEPVMPPPLRRPPGRPKRVRRKGVDEPVNPYRIRKHHQSLRCSKCRVYGHNTRTCKGEVNHKKKKASAGGQANAPNMEGAPQTCADGQANAPNMEGAPQTCAGGQEGAPQTCASGQEGSPRTSVGIGTAAGRGRRAATVGRRGRGVGRPRKVEGGRGGASRSGAAANVGAVERGVAAENVGAMGRGASAASGGAAGNVGAVGRGVATSNVSAQDKGKSPVGPTVTTLGSATFSTRTPLFIPPRPAPMIPPRFGMSKGSSSNRVSSNVTHDGPSTQGSAVSDDYAWK